jgi:MFS family permease
MDLLRHNPDFTRLWIAQVISLFGDWFSYVALAALVTQFSGGSGLAVSGLLIARFLPPFLVSPFAGVLVDRFNRQRLLIFSDAGRALIVLLMLLTVTGPERLWLIYLFTVLQFILSALFEPGRSAILPSVVKPDDLLSANTLGNVTWSAMLALGAVAGGVVATLFGAWAALVIDAASFGLSALFIALIRYQPRAEANGIKRTAQAGGGLREGFRYVRQNPAVAAVLFIKAGLSIGSTDGLIVAYATSLFVLGENGTVSLGLLNSAFGLGAIIGPLLMNRFNDGSVRTMRRLVIVSYSCVTLGWLLLGAAPTLLIVCLALIVRAMGGSITWTYSSTIIQMSVPDQFLGRVFSLDWAGFYLMITISTFLTGLLKDVLVKTYGGAGIHYLTLATGVISLIPLLLWASTVYWLERRQPAAVTAAK